MGGDNFAELFKGPSCYDNIVGSKARDHPEQTWTKAYKAKKGPVLEKCIVCSEMRVEKLESRSRMCPSCIRSEGVERVDCQFCLLDFFTKEKKKACTQCSKLRADVGEPRRCVVCKNHACFSSPGITDMCDFCHQSHKKHGEPKNCDSCGTRSAFVDAAKEDKDRNLCLRCTRRDELQAHATTTTNTTNTTSTTSVKPKAPSLPSGWKLEWSKKQNRNYYYHAKTGASQWEPPKNPKPAKESQNKRPREE